MQALAKKRGQVYINVHFVTNTQILSNVKSKFLMLKVFEILPYVIRIIVQIFINTQNIHCKISDRMVKKMNKVDDFSLSTKH